MDIKEKILLYIKNKKEKEEVKLLLDELINDTKHKAFDVFRTVKKYQVTEETKQVFEKFIQKEINTKQALELTKLGKTTFFKYLKEYKESMK